MHASKILHESALIHRKTHDSFYLHGCNIALVVPALLKKSLQCPCIFTQKRNMRMLLYQGVTELCSLFPTFLNEKL